MAIPLVSIVIPVYNGVRFIAATIESARAQDWPNTEIIVVDDGSRDGSLAVIRPFETARLRVIARANGGGSSARNAGFAASQGDYVQFLDHDDLLAPDKVSKQMAMAASDCSGPIGGLWTRFRGDVHGTFGGWQPAERFRDRCDALDWLIASPLVPTCAWLTPRSLVEAVGGWNETLVDNPDDDGEFFMRVFAQSESVLFCGAAHAYFRTEDSSSAGHVRTATAIGSIFEICKTYEAIVRGKTASIEARRACADRYLTFMYLAYPLCPALIQQAESRVVDLGFDPSRVPNTPSYEQLSKLTGWRLAKRLQQLWHVVRTSPADRNRTRH